MHKRLASDLTSLAHSILTMKNKNDVFALKEKAHEVYEKLSLLAYVEEYINTTPQALETKEELIAKIEKAEIKETQQTEQKKDSTLLALTPTSTLLDTPETIKDEAVVIGELDEDEEQMGDFANDVANDVIKNIEKEDIITKVEEITEQPFEELENTIFGKNEAEEFTEASFIEQTKNSIEDIKTPTLEDELKDTISVDVTADLFTKVEPKKSLNDRLNNIIQIGLNDRIAFVKHLFNGDSGDFNRVVSQLNTFSNEEEAKQFISKTVKPDYNWSDKEEYETRFLEIVTRKFI